MALPKTTGGSSKPKPPTSTNANSRESRSATPSKRNSPASDAVQEAIKEAQQKATIRNPPTVTPPAPPVKPVVLPSKTTPAPATIPVVTPEPYVAPITPAPQPPVPVPPTAQDLGVVKIPGRDVTNLANLVPVENADKINALFFNNMSALDLAQTLDARTIDGIEENYSIISNPSEIRKRYDASKNLTIMDKLAPISGVFDIDLNSKIPGEIYAINNNLNATYQYIDENNQLVTIQKNNLYISSNGDLVIEFDNIRDDEIIQVQIDSNGTIYEVTNLW